MTNIDSSNFEKEVMHSDKPVLVDFWATWCMPCRIIAPAIEELAHEMKGRARVFKSNIDESPDLANDLSVLNIPTLLFFKDGKEVSRMIGVNSKEAIKAKLASLAE
jgi:thioredoxin 1